MKHTQNKLSFSSTTGLFLIVLATGCSYSVTSHQFMYHGTDFPQTDKDFFYVEEGIFGSASAEYDYRGGGHVREGLVADAKADMKIGHPLGINQAYANLSIDVMETVSGKQWNGARYARRIELTAVVTADIIEFGEESESASRSMNNSGSLNSNPEVNQKKSNLQTKSVFQIGQTVLIEVREEWTEAEILEVDWISATRSYNYKVEYGIALGNHRQTYRSEENIKTLD